MKYEGIDFRLMLRTALAIAALNLAARAQSANSNPSPSPLPSIVQSSSQSGDRYRIGPGDLLDIRIYNRPQLSRDAVRVEGNGMIRMPLIEGDIQAACKTEGELSKEISVRYARFYRNLPVDVFIKEYHAREVALIGAVNEQGRYQMQRRIRLLELLTYAKGPSDKAGQTINIVRNTRAQACEETATPAEETAGFISLRLNDTLIKPAVSSAGVAVSSHAWARGFLTMLIVCPALSE